MEEISLPKFLAYMDMTPAQKVAFDARQGIRQSDREHVDGVQHMATNTNSWFKDCAGTYYPSMESVHTYMPQGRTFEPADDPLAAEPQFADAVDDHKFRMQMQGLKDVTAAINGESSSPVVFSNDHESVLNRKVQKSMETGQMMLKKPDNLFVRLQPLANKKSKGDFKAIVSRLQRPYYRLSEEDCKKVEALAGDSDVLLFDGKTQVTWGEADCGYALMPLNKPM